MPLLAPPDQRGENDLNVMEKACPHHESEANEAPDAAAAPEFWRSFNELADTAPFREALHREFPALASEWRDPVSRRNFMKVMGASVALAGMVGCTKQPEEKIIPWVQPPDRTVVPGRAMYFATAMPFGGEAIGLLAESQMGRPVKLEGNPDHPASLGATDIFAQASLLTLYDPDRAQVVTNAGRLTTWDGFVKAIGDEMAGQKLNAGMGLAILTGAICSPTLKDQIAQLLKRYPQARWYEYEPSRSQAAGRAGDPARPVYRLEKARRIVSLDSDFLESRPQNVRMIRDFAFGRKIRAGDEGTAGATAMNRLYAIECTPTLTGAMADHRLAVKPSVIKQLAKDLLAAVQSGKPTPAQTGSPDDAAAQFIAAAAADLLEHRAESVVVVGDHQPASVHALAQQINMAIGAVGTTVNWVAPANDAASATAGTLSDLVNEMRQGRVNALLMIETNPVLTAPVDSNFVELLTQVRLRIAHSLYYDETAYYCHWHLPASHYLESWSDARADDGTATIIQPLIMPLYQTSTPHDLLLALLGQRDTTARDTVREYWRGLGLSNDVDWQAAIEKGIVPNSAYPSVKPPTARADESSPDGDSPASDGFEIVFRPDPSIWDGRYANNGWLQELPKPLTKITWDNPALISIDTAVHKLKLAPADNPSKANGRMVGIKYRGRSIEMPVVVVPGHPDETITVHYGYGRNRAGRVGTGTGFNVYSIRCSDAMGQDAGAQIEVGSTSYPLACTQEHQMMEGRDIVRVVPIGLFGQASEHAPESPQQTERDLEGVDAESEQFRKIPLTLYPEYDYSSGHKWGMSIDMTSCVGCNACVIACQSENNIPVVGKAQVMNGREMQWMRIDAYYTGEAADPQGPYFQPMLCQHCEKAPCELVCPVGATTHSSEGLNEMVYNRCIGTRYCSNNCPYKVRRFNFLQYSDETTPVVQLGHNPDVTVRDRGVMEKCTYCVQRLNETRTDVKRLEVEYSLARSPEQKQAIRAEIDREMSRLQTACQQVCPAEAIVFGDLNYKDPAGRPSDVTRMHAQPHSYGVLTEYNTQPRTMYLSRMRNPNPALAPDVKTQNVAPHA